jgi:DNA-binding XRE family transcriptional regulator
MGGCFVEAAVIPGVVGGLMGPVVRGGAVRRRRRRAFVVRPGDGLLPPLLGRLLCSLQAATRYVIFQDIGKRNVMKEDIQPAQLRAARAIVDWSRQELAAAASTTERTIARIEAGDTMPRAATISAIRSALEAAGVEFIAENGGGAGVRLRDPE